MQSDDPKIKMKEMLDNFALKATKSIGSPISLVVHSIFFLVMFLLPVFGIDLNQALLILTTVVSLEAIYLSILIQIAVNRNTQDLTAVTQDVVEIQEGIGEIQEDVEEIQEDVEEIQEDVEDIQEDVEDIQEDVEEIQEDVEDIQEDMEDIEKDVNELSDELDAEDDADDTLADEALRNEYRHSIEHIKSSIAALAKEIKETNEKKPRKTSTTSSKKKVTSKK